jgi:ferrous iron transport protein B
MATIARELGQRWMLFSLAWNTGLAYAIAVLFYQLATVSAHPLETCLWVVGLGSVFLVILWLLYSWVQPKTA